MVAAVYTRSLPVYTIYLQARAERLHDIGDSGVHAVHAVGLQPDGSEGLRRLYRALCPQRVRCLG